MNAFEQLERSQVWKLYKKGKLNGMKHFYKSKTIWFGILNILVGFGLIILGEEKLGGFFILEGFGVIGLRSITKTKLTK